MKDTMVYDEWNGQQLGAHCLAFCLETNTDTSDEARQMPVLAAASTGDQKCVIRPNRIGDFLDVHRECLLVCYDVGPLFWTIEHHLASGSHLVVSTWWNFAPDGRR